VFLAWRAAGEGKTPDRRGTHPGLLAVPTYTFFGRHFNMAFHRIAATSGMGSGVSQRWPRPTGRHGSGVPSSIRGYSFRIALGTL
jgi:hypothetical protein